MTAAPRIIDREGIRRALAFERLIPALAEGFRQDHAGQAVAAPITNIDLHDVNGEMHIKPGYLRGGDWLCVKIATCYYDNPARGLPTRDGVLVLASRANGRIEALLCDAGLITDMRTAGASAVAVDALARPGEITLGLVGAGTQAFWHAAALSISRRITEVRLWGRQSERARAAVMRIREELGLPASAAPLELAAGSDVVVTATPAREPVLDKQRLRPGTLIVAMGADAVGKRELGPGVMEQVSLVVADSLGQCKRVGELQWLPEPSAVRVAELGAILNGAVPGRQHADDVIVFDSTGVAFQDVIGAAEVLRATGGAA